MEDVGTDRDLSEVSVAPLLAFQSNQSNQSPQSPRYCRLPTADSNLKAKCVLSLLNYCILYYENLQSPLFSLKITAQNFLY
jgi:hypothetical protein